MEQTLHNAFKRFSLGDELRAFTFLGCHAAERAGVHGYVFRVWAPRAQGVSVTGDWNFWNTEDLPMTLVEYGIWEAFSAYAREGDAYKFYIRRRDGSTVYKSDPYAFRNCALPDTSSRICTLDGYTWGDADYRRKQGKRKLLNCPMNIYEMHFGSWRRKPDGSLYTYDEKGRLSEKKEARGNSVTYEYDSNDRVAKAQYYETVDGAKTQTLETAYTYDVNGNVTRMCDYEVKDGARTLYRTTVYAYDPQNRLTSMAEWDGGELPTQEQIAQKKITYTYDTEGKVTGVDYALAKDGITGLTYTYDNDDYLTTITAKGGLLGKKLREYVYDDFGRVTEMRDYYGFAEGGSDHILRE